MPEAPPLPPHRLSIVVPLYNERDNVAPLAARVHEALADHAYPWELILVDDGSSDDALKHILEAEKRHGPHVRPVELTRNFKQTAAMQAGVDAARGDVIVADRHIGPSWPGSSSASGKTSGPGHCCSLASTA